MTGPGLLVCSSPGQPPLPLPRLPANFPRLAQGGPGPPPPGHRWSLRGFPNPQAAPTKQPLAPAPLDRPHPYWPALGVWHSDGHPGPCGSTSIPSRLHQLPRRPSGSAARQQGCIVNYQGALWTGRPNQAHESEADWALPQSSVWLKWPTPAVSSAKS